VLTIDGFDQPTGLCPKRSLELLPFFRLQLRADVFDLLGLELPAEVTHRGQGQTRLGVAERQVLGVDVPQADRLVLDQHVPRASAGEEHRAALVLGAQAETVDRKRPVRGDDLSVGAGDEKPLRRAEFLRS
jgi:hypothetical protein